MDLDGGPAAHLLACRGVLEDVHDLHAWTITSGVPVLSAHVEVPEELLARGEAGRVLDDLRRCLSGHFDVAHCTFQPEPLVGDRRRGPRARVRGAGGRVQGRGRGVGGCG